MNDLSITQSYYACAVNRRGAFPLLAEERQICLVAAGLIELRLAGCIAVEGKRIRITAPLPAECACLQPLYARLDRDKPLSLEKLVDLYSFSLSARPMAELTAAVGQSLCAAGLADEAKGGLFNSQTLYLPRTEAIGHTVDMVRAELLEDGPISDEAAAVAVLLDKSGCLKEYFSPFELRQMHDHLAALSRQPEGRNIQDMIDYVTIFMALPAVGAAVSAGC